MTSAQQELAEIKYVRIVKMNCDEAIDEAS